jgi:ATP-dependent helicase/nuclease subunit A
VVAALPPTPPDEADPGKFAYLQAFEAERAAHEARRLLYVAVTRARQQLHLVAVVSRKDDGLARPVADSLLGLLWPALADAFQAALAPTTDPALPALASGPPAPATDPGPLAQYSHRLERLRQPQCPAPLRPGASTASHNASAAASIATLPAADHRLAADTGVLVHRLLELVAQDGPDAWPAERVQALLPPLQQWLQARGHSPTQASEGAREAHAHLTSTLGAPEGRWLLAPHAQAASEWALGDAGPDGLQAHVIDRTFVVDGVRWIIDYKTAAVHEAAWADPSLLQAELARHRPQLERYRRLWPAEQAVTLAVFFTRYGRLCPLEP